MMTKTNKQRTYGQKSEPRLSIELIYGHVNILIPNYGQEVDYFDFVKELI